MNEIIVFLIPANVDRMILHYWELIKLFERHILFFKFFEIGKPY